MICPGGAGGGDVVTGGCVGVGDEVAELAGEGGRAGGGVVGSVGWTGRMVGAVGAAGVVVGVNGAVGMNTPL